MKAKSYLLTIILLVCLSFSYAQKDSLQIKLPRYEVKMSLLGSGSILFSPSSEYWEKATPDFVVPDSFNMNKGFFRHGGGGGAPTFLFSFSLINNASKVQKFRAATTFHIGIGPRMSAYQSWSYTEKTTVDTLLSLQTGTSYLVEENRELTINKTFHSSSFVLGVGQRISTNPNRVFKFESGVDALFLIGFQNHVSVSSYESYSVSSQAQVPNYYGTSAEFEQKTYKAKSMAGMIVRIPLDFSFRFSNRRKVAKDMRIGWELNPGMNLLFKKGTRLTNNYIFSGGVNFRYQF